MKYIVEHKQGFLNKDLTSETHHILIFMINSFCFTQIPNGHTKNTIEKGRSKGRDRDGGESELRGGGKEENVKVSCMLHFGEDYCR